MDNYCRTCMRDSNKFSPIFEEMTYGGISLQEAIEDVCQLEISIGDDLSLYVCRDCALKIYDIVKFKMEAHEVYTAMRKLTAIHPRIKVENYESMEEARPSYSETENINVEDFCDSHFNEVSPFYPEIENIKVEQLCGSHSNEDSYNASPDPYENATIFDDGNFELSQSSVKVENSIRGTDSFEGEMPRLILEETDIEEEVVEVVNIPPGDMKNKFAAVFRDTPELPSIFLVNRESLNDPEVTDNENLREDIFQSSIQRIAGVKENVCGQKLFSNGKGIEVNEIQIEDRKRKSKDVSLTGSNHQLSRLHDSAEGKGRLGSREKYCHSDGTHLPKRTEDDEITENGSAESNSMVKQGEGEPVDEISYLSEATAASVVIDTIENTGDQSYICHVVLEPIENPGVQSYICHVCYKRFYRRSVLKEHEKLHFAEKPFECEFCSRKFTMEYTLERHQKIHKMCRKSFSGDDRNDINSSCSIESLKQGSTEELDKLPIRVFDVECENENKNPITLRDTNVPLHEGGSIDYPKRFICDRCRKEFSNKIDLMEHLILHYGRRSSSRCSSSAVGKTVHHLPPDSESMNERGSNVFKRDKEERVRLKKKSCGKESVVDCALNIPETVRGNNSAERSFACQYCSMMFRNASHRKRHELIHTEEKPFACKYCSKMFRTTDYRKRHEMIHTGEKPFACTYCAMRFRTVYHQKMHEMTHSGEKPFACKYCSKMFRTIDYRKRHEMIHTGEKPFSCNYCAMRFRTVYHQKMHEMIHSGEKPFACTYCSKMFRTTDYRKRHEMIHTGEKPFSCKYCAMRFRTVYHQKMHEMTHSGEKPFACTYCSKMFRTTDYRKRHEMIHTGEKPFSCKYCAMRFRTVYHQKMHEMTHSGEKPFACTYCSKMFITKSKRKRHERTHSGERPFECELCSKKFARKDNLKIHELIH